MRYELVDVDVERIRPLLVPPKTSGLGVVFRREDRIVGFALRESPAGTCVTVEGVKHFIAASVPPPATPSPPPVDRTATLALGSLSVVVCTRNRSELLVRCLKSIIDALARVPGLDHEVVVVDNAPSDQRTRLAVASMQGVRYVQEPVAGLNVARNRGWRVATGDVVAFTDDDVVVDRWWAAALMEAWREDPGAAVITGSVLPYELESDAQILFERCGGFSNGFQRMRYRDLPAARAWLEICACGAGCNMSVRRTSAVSLRGFDENLDTGHPLPGGGDLDLFHRAVRGGGMLVYAPSVVVHHQHRRTMKQLHKQYRSWGTTWMTCVMHRDPHERFSRRTAWVQALTWCRWQLGRLRASDPRERGFVVSELVGALRGMTGEYRRSERRMARRRRVAAGGTGVTVAILPWGHVIEDYLDAIGVSLDEFVEKMSGGWLFGYVEALEVAGVRAVLVVVSSAITRPQRLIHASTGATMWLMPSPKVYRRLRRSSPDPYAFDWRAGLDARQGRGRVRRELAWAVCPWVSTPLRSLRRVLRDEACDALVCQEYEEPRFDLCVAFRRFLGVRVFATFQGGSHTRSFERPVRGWSVRRAAGLVIADEREAARVGVAHRVDPNKIATIPNPLAPAPPPDSAARAVARASLGLDPEAPVALWYGRVDRYAKGLDTLVDAWDIVSAGWHSDPRPVLLLVGRGPDDDWLRERLTAGHGMVSWHEQYVLDRRILETRLAAADLFVQPSRREGFAVAPMEAMAAALPVIATDAPGIHRLLGDDAGTIVPATPDALAEAIADAFADPAASRRLGDRGCQRIASEFSSAAVGHALAAFFGGSDVPVR